LGGLGVRRCPFRTRGPQRKKTKGETRTHEPTPQPPRGGGGLLRISSVGADRMGAKIKTPKKCLGLPTKPKKSLDQKLTSKKIPCRISEPQKFPERIK